MQTLLLDPSTWDLTLDANGNIAVASEPYALAQDAASAILTFLGEVFYDTTLGVPYWQSILGLFPSASFLKSRWNAAAMAVPDVAAATTFIVSWTRRGIVGQVQVTSVAGPVSPVVAFLVQPAAPSPLPFGP